MNPGSERQLLRVADAADRLGVSPRVAYEWLANGVIPAEVVVRAGRAVYIKRQALDAWLAGRNGKELPMP
jgi:excisionase family DNA binding protein